jgi:hypothetical protein
MGPSENMNMGPLKLGGECGITHIGGAKTIRRLALYRSDVRYTSAQRVTVRLGSRTARRENAP